MTVAQTVLTLCVMLKDLPLSSLTGRTDDRVPERVVLTFLKPKFRVAVAPQSKSLEVQVDAESLRPNLLVMSPV